MKTIPRRSIQAFQKKIYRHFDGHGRSFPWRRNLNPYRVVISEIMLQQTQVVRVVGKYGRFLASFPDFPALAAAPTPKLLSVWSGMGYNRRALALRALAQQVMTEHRGRLPKDREKLLALPGVGPYTAGAVLAFAFNLPVVFMDTNIRRVYLHEFFQDRTGVHDNELLPLVDRSMDRENPRKWYNALMDYGAMLKLQENNPNRRSAHYCRQSPFENSNRQVRGAILKLLVRHAPLSRVEIIQKTGIDAERVDSCLVRLENEGFVTKKGRLFLLY